MRRRDFITLLVTPRYDLVRFGTLLCARLLAADLPETRTVLDHWFVLLIFWSLAAEPRPMQNPLVGGRAYAAAPTLLTRAD